MTEDDLRTCYAAVKEFGGILTAAGKLGIHQSTCRNRYRAAVNKLGLPPLPLPPRGCHSHKTIGTYHVPADVPADPVVVRRLTDQLGRARKDLADLEKRLVAAEDLRAGVFGLASDPIEPVAFPAPTNGDGHGETILLFLSDLHWGEKIGLAAMDGLNSFNLDIARARLGRYFASVVDLATRHWSGRPPERIILILGGDLVSGEIHEELAKTNEAKSLPAVRDVVAYLSAGVNLLLGSLACPIDIISVVGNHGRSTRKPESKESVETSYDTLVVDFLEMQFARVPRVTFYKPASPDAVFSIYGWRFLATHGDKIGSRGGQGFIGPAATAGRGFKRLVQEYAARGIHLDRIIIGHFHTPLELEEGYVNGSLPGPSEYGRDGRFRPTPPKQLFLSVHPRRGVTQHRWIMVGAPSEGALYEPPPADREMRPRYRVQAKGVRE